MTMPTSWKSLKGFRGLYLRDFKIVVFLHKYYDLPQLAKFPQGGGLTFYIHVSDIHGLYKKLNGKVTIAKEMHETFYGSTDFAIEDCNGYILTFSQENTK